LQSAETEVATLSGRLLQVIGPSSDIPHIWDIWRYAVYELYQIRNFSIEFSYHFK